MTMMDRFDLVVEWCVDWVPPILWPLLWPAALLGAILAFAWDTLRPQNLLVPRRLRK